VRAGKLFSQTQKITKGVVSGLVIGWLMTAYKMAQKAGYPLPF